MRKRRMELTIEGHEIIAIRRAAGRIKAWCSECERDVYMVTADEAAALAGSSGREVYRLVEAGLLHGTSEGPLRVCLSSLSDLPSHKEPQRDENL
jgi:hypothetical protein